MRNFVNYLSLGISLVLVSKILDAMQSTTHTDVKSFYRLTDVQIVDILDVIDHECITGGDIILHCPDEHGRAVSDVDSYASDEELAGDLNRLGPGLLNCTRDFIPHTEGIEEKDDNENNECNVANSRSENREVDVKETVDAESKASKGILRGKRKKTCLVEKNN